MFAKGPMREIVSTIKVNQPPGGPTKAAYFWALTLQCGHRIMKTAHAKIPLRARCDQCARPSTRRSTT